LREPESKGSRKKYLLRLDPPWLTKEKKKNRNSGTKIKNFGK
jgi:hypothetical protein